MLHIPRSPSYLLHDITCILLTELVQTEDRYDEVKDALKLLNKMDFDKLISCVNTSSFFSPEITNH